MIYDYNEELRELKIDDKLVIFTETQNRIFKKLYENMNKVVKYDELMEIIKTNGYLWYDSHYLAVLMHRLNKLIKSDDLEIENRHKLGYVLKG